MDLYQFMVLLIVLSDIQPPPDNPLVITSLVLTRFVQPYEPPSRLRHKALELPNSYLVIYALRGPLRSLLIPIRLLDRDTDSPLPRKVTLLKHIIFNVRIGIFHYRPSD